MEREIIVEKDAQFSKKHIKPKKTNEDSDVSTRSHSIISNSTEFQQKYRRDYRKRIIRTSRLDHSCIDSSIRKSEFWGFLNLLYICVGIFLVSDPVTRFLESGSLVDPTLARAMFNNSLFLFLLWLGNYTWCFAAFFSHKFYVKSIITRFHLRCLQVIIESLLIGGSTFVCVYCKWSILPTVFSLSCASVFFMKAHSFTETLLEFHDLRAYLVTKYPQLFDNKSVVSAALKLGTLHPELASYYDKHLENLRLCKTYNNSAKSQVLNVQDNQNNQLKLIYERELNVFPTFIFYLYYLACPVLVYESSYPKSKKFRSMYFLRKLIEMLSEMVALYFISTRYLIPAMVWSVDVHFLRAILQLLWPMLVCHFLLFLIIFESICNMLAEITSFGDREFYLDWWNSTTWEEFSRKWNKPVHEFLLRHVYCASLKQFGWSKFAASVATFCFSALIHEIIMASCFKIIRFWMFGLMMSQLPLIQLMIYYKGKTFGNCVFWVEIILGIPLLSVAYGRAYVMQQLK